jgi:hypothetical protein
MMNLPEVLRRVHCPTCDWHAIWGPEAMLQVLRQRGALRREKEPDTALVLQLIEQAASQLSCTACQQTGLQLEPWTADFDDGPLHRPCEICGKWIPDERIEVFPQATRCATCQDKPDDAWSEDDFCPRCGGHVQARLVGGAAVARYRMACRECGWKQ